VQAVPYAREDGQRRETTPIRIGRQRAQTGHPAERYPHVSVKATPFQKARWEDAARRHGKASARAPSGMENAGSSPMVCSSARLKIGDAAMAYIPSKALWEILEGSQAGIWIDRLQVGEVALVCKAHEAVIKSLYQGAICSFLLSIVKVESFSIMCLALRVQDEPDNPYIVMAPRSSPGELASVKEILSSRITRLHCVNELNHPVLSASCLLDTITAQGALDGLRSVNLTPIRVRERSELYQILDLALHRFSDHIYQSGPVNEGEMIAIIPLALDIGNPGEVFDQPDHSRRAFSD
jgi:hypothetical protein